MNWWWLCVNMMNVIIWINICLLGERWFETLSFIWDVKCWWWFMMMIFMLVIYSWWCILTCKLVMILVVIACMENVGACVSDSLYEHIHCWVMCPCIHNCLEAMFRILYIQEAMLMIHLYLEVMTLMMTGTTCI
jgi:hypothetical protein